jgi:membrane protease YdiL (CAAX protease family)
MTEPLEPANTPDPGQPPAESDFDTPRFSEDSGSGEPPVKPLEEGHTALDFQVPARPPGPGIQTGLLWMLSVLVIHFAGILIAGIVLFAVNLEVLQEVTKNPQAASKILDPFMKDNTFFLMAGEMLVFALAAVLVTRLKHGRQTSRVLGLRPIPWPSLLLIVASVLPLSLLCSGLHQKVLPAWKNFAADHPSLDLFSGMDINEQLLPLGESTPAWLLLLVIAVAPAIGEELIFRGIIGHGLVARHGLFVGVFVTSIYFAAVHIHPAHVLTLMPLAVFLHLSWLATRSFYAPVLIHFLNNALAVFVLKNSAQLQEAAKEASEFEGSWAMIGIAAFVLFPATIALWKNRVEFRLEDGSVWSPGYETAATPPASVGATAVYENRAPWPYAIGLILCGGISALFVVSTVAALL